MHCNLKAALFFAINTMPIMHPLRNWTFCKFPNTPNPRYPLRYGYFGDWLAIISILDIFSLRKIRERTGAMSEWKFNLYHPASDILLAPGGSTILADRFRSELGSMGRRYSHPTWFQISDVQHISYVTFGRLKQSRASEAFHRCLLDSERYHMPVNVSSCSTELVLNCGASVWTIDVACDHVMLFVFYT